MIGAKHENLLKESFGFRTDFDDIRGAGDVRGAQFLPTHTPDS